MRTDAAGNLVTYSWSAPNGLRLYDRAGKPLNWPGQGSNHIALSGVRDEGRGTRSEGDSSGVGTTPRPPSTPLGALSLSKGSPLAPSPIPLTWPQTVALSETHAYVADTPSRRVVKVRLAWAAEETIAAP